ncbi:glycosyltransferase [Synechococcus sp. GEYO]|uniref:glycosyltransferase n=1 Tax=Synechococcus sp. GEYO TaxID=2575511 RepID=UPI000E0F22B4|nr:glycosyltransferase [Synechococcus sp. GEYO]
MRLINLLSWLPGHSGFGSYVQRVVPEIDGLRLQLGSDGLAQLLDPDHWQPQSPPWAPGKYMRLLQRYSLVQHGLNFSDVLFRHDFHVDQLEAIYSPFFDALLCCPDVPQLITCHDLTPLSASNSCKAWLRYKFWQPRHCSTASRLIAISRYVADQLVLFGIDSSRIEVIPNGVTIQRPPIGGPASTDLLVLARHDVNKNLLTLLRGVSLLQRQAPNWRGILRIVGRNGRQTSKLMKLRQELPRPQQVQFINSISQDELVNLFRASFALISASSEEGFDYPILEAKAEGLPTLISDIRVHKEFHSGSSLFFPTHDDGHIFAQQVMQLLIDHSLWKQLSTSGFDLACSLSIRLQVQRISDQFSSLVSL